METLGTARLADEIPADRAVTAVVSRHEVAGALQDREHTPELYLDIDRPGEARSTLGISWSHEELEEILERATGDDIVLTFDRNELASAFDDVEAHGLRQTAAIFAVAAAGALGSGAAIANAAPSIEPGTGSVASPTAVQTLAADSIATTGGVTSNVHTPGLQTGDEASTAPAASVRASTAKAAGSGVMSNVHTPGLQTGDEASTAPAASVRVSAAQAADTGVASNVHTPGLQVGPGEDGTAAAASSVRAAGAADAAVASNVHTPGLQIGPAEDGSPAAASSARASHAADSGLMSNVHTPGLQLGVGDDGSAVTPPAVKVSVDPAGGSSGEFLGISGREATDGLIAGGILLAIAGATFAGARRPGSARPA